MTKFNRARARSFSAVWLSMLAIFLATLGPGSSSQAQTTLNVTNFGAVGDAAQILVSTTSNSAVVVTTNQFSRSDVGKVMCLFGAGPSTTPTNNQDLVVTIVAVSNGTNVTISSVAGATSANIQCTYGTQDATAFQNCINAAPTNTTIIIPSGNYLLISPQALDTSFAMINSDDTHPAVTISKGGLHFLGAGQTNTILTGNGAWQLKGGYVYRGYMFALLGPVTNDAPLIFDSLTMNGGVANGQQSYNYWPALTNDGSGWDVTHDAVIDVGAPLHLYKSFTNCTFTKWRGEMVKSVSTWTNGFIDIGHCTFFDGNASAINFSFSHNIHDNTFIQTKMVMEFYQAYCSTTCYFSNNLVTNMASAGLAFNGAVTNKIMASYYVSSNRFYLGSGGGIYTSPANNLYIIGNQFYGGADGIALGTAGYQGTAINSNIVVQFNTFSNTYFVLEVNGAGGNAVADVLVSSNTAAGCSCFAYGYGWVTNISFVGNVANGILNSTLLTSQWFPDNLSNQFPFQLSVGATAATNTLSYSYGMRQSTWSQYNGSSFQLDDVRRSQIPSGAMMVVSNLTSSTPEQLYTSSTSAVAPITLANGASLTFQWTNGVWRLFSQLAPPTDLHIIAP
jgi:hypothetical protein